MKVFCSGVGGIGLSAYASHMKMEGHEVQGSDRSKSGVTDDLIALGIPVSFTQDGADIPKDADLFVYSEAIPETSAERLKAKELGIPEKSYFAALGDMTRGKYVVCIAGTHGKSSTTAMLAGILIDAGEDPNVVLGTRSQKLAGKNWRKGKGKVWVIEACEYRRSFLHLSPTVTLLTNADGDHYDSFKDHKDYLMAFQEFIQKLPKDGLLLHHGKDSDSVRVAATCASKIIDVDRDPLPTLQVPGQHMRENAALAKAAGEYLKVPTQKIDESLLHFPGTWRRMERKRVTAKGTIVIDDYAHHPKEIRATLSAMREAYPTKRIVCVYQPHTHDRTLKLWADFIASFVDCDLVILAGMYDARPDRDAKKVRIEDFAKDIQKSSQVTVLCNDSLSGAHKATEASVQNGDVVITMGAGDITKLSDELVLP